MQAVSIPPETHENMKRKSGRSLDGEAVGRSGCRERCGFESVESKPHAGVTHTAKMVEGEALEDAVLSPSAQEQ